MVDPTHAPTSRKVACPTCGAPSVFGPSNLWRPFCSQRCRSVDLGAWASERFRVPAEAPPDPGTEVPSEAGPAANHKH
jgi:endogenous inhibitor of DNA gyrase (YacG/DUF329 family)